MNNKTGILGRAKSEIQRTNAPVRPPTRQRDGDEEGAQTQSAAPAQTQTQIDTQGGKPASTSASNQPRVSVGSGSARRRESSLGKVRARSGDDTGRDGTGLSGGAQKQAKVIDKRKDEDIHQDVRLWTHRQPPDGARVADSLFLHVPKPSVMARGERGVWLVERLHTTITIDSDNDSKGDADPFGARPVSVIYTQEKKGSLAQTPTKAEMHQDSQSQSQTEKSAWIDGAGKSKQCYILPSTKLSFFTNKYRVVFMLDLSPSMVSMDRSRAAIHCEQLADGLQKMLSMLTDPLKIPALATQPCPELYVSVIVQGSTLDQCVVVIENVLVDKTNHVQLCQKVRQDIVVAENQFANTYAPERMVSRDLGACIQNAYFVLTTKKDESWSHVVVFTDGVGGLPDSFNYDSLFMVLNRQDIPVSVVRVGSSFYAAGGFGYVSDPESLRFLASSTGGKAFDLSAIVSGDMGVDTQDIHSAIYLRSIESSDSLDGLSAHRASSIRQALGGKTLGYADEMIVDKTLEIHQLVAIENAYPWIGEPPPVPQLRVSAMNLYQVTPIRPAQLIEMRLREGFRIQYILVGTRPDPGAEATEGIFIKLVAEWQLHIRVEYCIVASWPLLADLTALEELSSASGARILTPARDKVEVYGKRSQFKMKNDTATIGLSLVASYEFQRQYISYQSGTGHPLSPTPARLESFLMMIQECDRTLSRLVHTVIARSYLQGALTAVKQSRASDRAVELDQGLRSLVQQLSTLPTHYWHRWFRVERIEVLLRPDEEHREMLNPKAIAVGVTAVFSDANYDISNTALMQICQKWASLALSRHTFLRFNEVEDKASGGSATSKAKTTERTIAPGFCHLRLSWETRSCVVIRLAFFMMPVLKCLDMTAELRSSIQVAGVSTPEKEFYIGPKPLRQFLVRYEDVPRLAAQTAPVAPVPMPSPALDPAMTAMFRPQGNATVSNVRLVPSLAGTYPVLYSFMKSRKTIWDVEHDSIAEVAVELIVRERINQGFLTANHGVFSFFKEITVWISFNYGTNPASLKPGDFRRSSVLLEYLIFRTHNQRVITEALLEPQTAYRYSFRDPSDSVELLTESQLVQRIFSDIFEADMRILASLCSFQKVVVLCGNKNQRKDSIPGTVVLRSPLVGSQERSVPFKISTVLERCRGSRKRNYFPVLHPNERASASRGRSSSMDSPSPQILDARPKSRRTSVADSVVRSRLSIRVDEDAGRVRLLLNVDDMSAITRGKMESPRSISSESVHAMQDGPTVVDEAGILAGNRLLHQMFENALRALCDAELPVTADDIEKICQRDGIPARHGLRCFAKKIHSRSVILVVLPSFESITSVSRISSAADLVEVAEDAQAESESGQFRDIPLYTYDCHRIDIDSMQREQSKIGERAYAAVDRLHVDVVKWFLQGFAWTVFYNLRHNVHVSVEDFRRALQACCESNVKLELGSFDAMYDLPAVLKDALRGQGQPDRMGEDADRVGKDVLGIISEYFARVPGTNFYYYAGKIDGDIDDGHDQPSFRIEMGEGEFGRGFDDAEDRHSLDSSSLTGSLPTSRAVSPILGVGQAWRGVGPTSVPEEMKSLVQKLECPLFLRIEVLDESEEVGTGLADPWGPEHGAALSFSCIFGSPSSDCTLSPDGLKWTATPPSAGTAGINLPSAHRRTIRTMMSRIRERLSIAVLEELASVHPIEMDTVQSVLQHMNNLSANSKDYIPIPLVFQYPELSSSMFNDELRKEAVLHVQRVSENVFYVASELNATILQRALLPLNTADDFTEPDSEGSRPQSPDAEWSELSANLRKNSVELPISTTGDAHGILSPIANDDFEKPEVLPYWLVIVVRNDMAEVHFYANSTKYSPVQKHAILSSIHAGISAVMKRTNQKALLKKLLETKMCSNLLVPATAEDLALSSNANADADAVSSNGIFSDGEFACPLIISRRLELHERLPPVQALRTLTLSTTLQPHLVANRANMVVYSGVEGAIFYMRLTTYPSASGEAPAEPRALNKTLTEITSQAVISGRLDIPHVIQAGVEYILAYGTSEPGIFDVGCSSTKLADLQNAFEKTNTLEPAMIESPHLVAHLIIHRLRRMGESLIPPDLYEACLEAFRSPDEAERNRALWAQIKTIASQSRRLLSYLLQFFRKIADKSEVNGMTAAKLATIFASYFLKASATVTPPSHPDRTVSATNVVEYMIMHHNAIFERPSAPPEPRFARNKPVSRSTSVRPQSSVSQSAPHLILDVYGVEPDAEDVERGLLPTIIDRLNSTTLQLISAFISRNPLQKLTAADIDFLRPPGVPPAEDSVFDLPPCIRDTYIYLHYLRENLLVQSIGVLNYPESRAPRADLQLAEGTIHVRQEDFAFVYNGVPMPHAGPGLGLGQGTACMFLYVMDESGAVVQTVSRPVEGGEVISGLDLDSWTPVELRSVRSPDGPHMDPMSPSVETAAVSFSPVLTTGTARLSVGVKVYIHGNVNLEGLMKRLQVSFSLSVLEYLLEVYLLQNPLDVHNLSEDHLRPVQRLLQRGAFLNPPSLQTLRTPLLVVPGTIEKFMAELGEVLRDQNPKFRPSLHTSEGGGALLLAKQWTEQSNASLLSPSQSESRRPSVEVIATDNDRGYLLSAGLPKNRFVPRPRKTADPAEARREMAGFEDFSSNANMTYSHMIHPSLPFVIPRLCFTLQTYKDREFVCIAYNWTKALFDGYSQQFRRLLLFCTMRLQLLQCILLQKMGVFNVAGHVAGLGGAAAGQAAPALKGHDLGLDTLDHFVPNVVLARKKLDPRAMQRSSTTQKIVADKKTSDTPLAEFFVILKGLVPREPDPTANSAQFEPVQWHARQLKNTVGFHSTQEADRRILQTVVQTWSRPHLVAGSAGLQVAHILAAIRASRLLHTSRTPLLFHPGKSKLFPPIAGASVPPTPKSGDSKRGMNRIRRKSASTPVLEVGRQSPGLVVDTAPAGALGLADWVKLQNRRQSSSPVLTGHFQPIIGSATPSPNVTSPDPSIKSAYFNADSEKEALAWFDKQLDPFVSDLCDFVKGIGAYPVAVSDGKTVTSVPGTVQGADGKSPATAPAMVLDRSSISGRKLYIARALRGGILIIEVFLRGMFVSCNLFVLQGSVGTKAAKGSSGDEDVFYKYSIQTAKFFTEDYLSFQATWHINSFIYDFQLRQIFRGILDPNDRIPDIIAVMKCIDRYFATPPKYSRNRLVIGSVEVEVSLPGVTAAAFFEYLCENAQAYGLRSMNRRGVNGILILSTPDMALLQSVPMAPQDPMVLRKSLGYCMIAFIDASDAGEARAGAALKVSFCAMRVDCRKVHPLKTSSVPLPVAAIGGVQIMPVEDAVPIFASYFRSVVEAAQVHFERDRLWNLLTTHRKAEDKSLLVADLEAMMALVERRPIEDFDKSLRFIPVLNSQIISLVGHLRSTFGPRCRVVEGHNKFHVLLLHDTQESLMLQMIIERDNPERKNALNLKPGRIDARSVPQGGSMVAYVVRREKAKGAMAEALIDFERELISRLVNSICHWMWRLTIIVQEHPKQRR